MSAIGRCVRMKTSDLDRCLAIAAQVTPAPPSRWPWQKPAESLADVFAREWAGAVLDDDVFAGSGYLLSSYFLAQNELNGVPDPFDSPEGLTLAKVFTAAFPVRAPQALPPLDPTTLAAFCDDEWGDDGPGMFQGIQQADGFLRAGMSRRREGEAVVFLIA